MSDIELITIVGAVLVAYTVQMIAGFGATILAITLAAHVAPISTLVSLLIPISLLQSTAIAVHDREHLEYRLVLREVIPLMGAGTVVGFALSTVLEDDRAKSIFGVLVVALALRELWALRSRRTLTQSRWQITLALVGAGVGQGLYGTGGPLLAYALGKRVADKRAFRGTICAIFAVVNLGLVLTFVITGRLSAEHAPIVGLLALPLVVTFLVGNRLHKLIDPVRFRYLIFGLLVFAGAALI